MEAPAVVVDYDSAWPDDFAAIRDYLAPALPPWARVEHVGSTSVPGLAAKPIIDVDVVLASERDMAAAIDVLQTLGYEHQGNGGIEGREAFSVLPGLPYHHVYAVIAGSKPHRDHLDLRDYLRTHPAEAQRYAAQKRRVAHLLTTDREAYVGGKSQLVEHLLAASRSVVSRGSGPTVR